MEGSRCRSRTHRNATHWRRALETEVAETDAANNFIFGHGDRFTYKLNILENSFLRRKVPADRLATHSLSPIAVADRRSIQNYLRESPIISAIVF